eukprot:4871449-Pleurochrysis_carterae.AAC.1
MRRVQNSISFTKKLHRLVQLFRLRIIRQRSTHSVALRCAGTTIGAFSVLSFVHFASLEWRAQHLVKSGITVRQNWAKASNFLRAD